MNDILLLTVIIALVFGAIGVSTPLITLYLESLGAGYGRIALIMASTALVGLVASYVWGRASDALGRRKPLIAAGLAALAVAYFTLSQVASPTLAWLVRLGEAAGGAAYSTASLALMGDLLYAGWPARPAHGCLSGDRLAGLCLRSAGWWSPGRCLLARVPLICAPCSTWQPPSWRWSFTKSPRPRGAPARQPDRSSPAAAVQAGQPSGPAAPGAWERLLSRIFHPELPVLFLAGVFLFMAAWNAQASMWPNYLASFGYSKTAISSLWGLAGLVEAPSMWLAGQWSDVVGRVTLLAAGGFGAAVVILAYTLVGRFLPPLIGVQVVRGLVFGTYTANSMTFAVETGDDRSRGRNSGVFNMVGSAGQLAGLLMGGNLVQAAGFNLMYVTCACAVALSGVCFLALRRRDRRLSQEVLPSA